MRAKKYSEKGMALETLRKEVFCEAFLEPSKLVEYGVIDGLDYFVEVAKHTAPDVKLAYGLIPKENPFASAKPQYSSNKSYTLAHRAILNH